MKFSGQPSLSFCAIVKNEAQNLPRCLTSVREFVDEMIVVDTGSEDATVAIAQQYGAAVKHFSWCNNFSTARNFAISQVAGDWILTLDADEELIVNDRNWRSCLSMDPDVLLYSMILLDVHQPITGLPTTRLFRNLPEMQYAGRYHEQLLYQGQTINLTQVESLQSVHILHYGYEASQLVQKRLHRDIPLLEQTRQQEGLNLLLLGTLADAYLYTGQLEQAQGCWAEALERLSLNLLTGELPAETIRLSALLFAVGADLLFTQENFSMAMLVCRRGLEWFPNYPPLNHLTGCLLRELGLPLAAIAYFQYCLEMGRLGSYYQHEPSDRRFITILPAYDLGITYQRLHRVEDAMDALKLALSFDPNDAAAQVALAAMQAS